jgi:DNA-binding CsgD family transcriptional regulator
LAFGSEEDERWKSASRHPMSQQPTAISHQPSVLDTLGSLIEQNLLRQSTGSSAEPRYLMLETVREFGLERLAAEGEAAETQRRHAAWYCALAEAAEPELDGPRQAFWQDRLEIELPNLRAALAWATAHDPDQALRLSGALRQFWLVRGHLDEACGVLERALASGTGAAPARAKAMVAAAWIRFAQGDFAAGAALGREALVLSQSVDNQLCAVAALLVVGSSETRLAREVSPPDQDRFSQASAVLEEGLSLSQTLDDRWSVGSALYILGDLALHQGDAILAAERFATSLSVFETLGDQRSTGWTLVELGRVAVQQGDDARAAPPFGRALGVFHELGDRWSTVQVIADVAELVLRAGRAEDAVRLFAASDALRAADGIPLSAARHARRGPLTAAVRAALGEKVFDVVRTSGEALTLEEAVAQALASLDSVAMSSEQVAAESLDTIGLTPREREVLQLLAEGLSDRQIGAALALSPRTVGVHVSHVLTKLGAETRTAAVAIALRQGLV